MSIRVGSAPLPRIIRVQRDLVLRFVFVVLAIWPLVIAAVVLKGLLTALF